MRLDYRVKVVLLLLSGLAILVAGNVGYAALNTLSQLDVVEAQRNQWQRPGNVIQALGLSLGNVVADVGCGSGYFTLKLSAPVGSQGRVIAEDIRKLPLAFLWIRTVTRRERNVHLVLGDDDDPRLPAKGVNAILISNTYHEFGNARAILGHLSQSLVDGGTLVVVDREPKTSNDQSQMGEHEISAERVEMELQQAKFAIVKRQDHFIESVPDHETWWLIVARNP